MIQNYDETDRMIDEMDNAELGSMFKHGLQLLRNIRDNFPEGILEGYQVSTLVSGMKHTIIAAKKGLR